MNPNTRKLHDPGQRLWLDNITREMLNDGIFARYIAELSVTGLRSNPTIFEHAIGSGELYDEAIQKLASKGSFASRVQTSSDTQPSLPPLASKIGRNRSAAWVRSCNARSKKMSSLDTAGTTQAAARLHARAARPNLFIKIPGTPEGIPAIDTAKIRFRRRHTVLSREQQRDVDRNAVEDRLLVAATAAAGSA